MSNNGPQLQFQFLNAALCVCKNYLSEKVGPSFNPKRPRLAQDCWHEKSSPPILGFRLTTEISF